MTLTNDEKQVLQKELIAEITKLKEKASALGLGDITGSNRPVQKYAPDGGPVSSAHVFMKAQRTSTMTVLRTMPSGEQVECLINRKDFCDDTDVDPNASEEARAEKPARKARTRRKKKQAALPTPDELWNMDLAELLQLPEVDGIKDLPESKDELVDRILAGRG